MTSKGTSPECGTEVCLEGLIISGPGVRTRGPFVYSRGRPVGLE